MPRSKMALLQLCLLGLFSGWGSALSAANITHNYLIDRSAVPATVFHRKLSLLVDLGNCSACQALADGVSTTATWLPASKQCRVEVAGNVTGVSVTGLNWSGGGTGAVQKATLYQGKKWAYSFTWDDSRDSVLPNAKPVFDAYGYRAGLAINPGIMGGWGYMTWADLDQLAAAGWGVFNHSWDHDSANGIGITAANVDAEIDPARSAIQARYPGYPDSYFVYPFNYINDWASLKAKGFLGAEAETGENYVDNWPIETSPQASWSGFGATDADSFWLLRRHQAYRDTPVSTWNGWLDNAAADARPRWCISFSHQCIASPGFYDITPAMLNTHLKYLHDNYGAGGADNVWMAPSEEVLHYLYARRYTVVTELGSPLTPSCTATWAPSATVTPTRSPTPSPTPYPCGLTVLRRVNAGGSAYTDGSGKLWEADQLYSPGGWGAVGGTADAVADPIAGTTDDVLYQSERWGSPVEYRFTVPNGTYQVRLLFAEVYWTAAGARVFDISLEGATAVSGLDIWALVGKDKATELTRSVTVSDGVLNVVASASADAAKFSAIELSLLNACSSPSPSASATRSASPTGSPTSTRTLTGTVTPTRTVTNASSPTLSATPLGTGTATGSATGTGTPAPSITASTTPTATVATTATTTATATVATTATATLSGTVTTTATAAITAMATSTATATQSAGPSGTFTLASSASSTATISVTASPTPSISGSPSATVSCTRSPLPSPSPTCACVLTPTLTPSGGGEARVEQVLGLPNPNPTQLGFKLAGSAASLELRIYGAAQVCMGVHELAGPWAEGWNRVALPLAWAAGAANGVYYLRLAVKASGQAAGAKALGRVVLLR